MYLPEVFKALGDVTRLRILNLLSKRELCVCQVNEVLKLSQPNASKHLNKLKFAGIIKCRKISQWCFYQIDQHFITTNPGLYQFLVEQWAGNDQFNEDNDELEYVINKFDCCRKLQLKFKENDVK